MRLILVRNAKCSQHIYPISQPVASAHACRVYISRDGVGYRLVSRLSRPRVPCVSEIRTRSFPPDSSPAPRAPCLPSSPLFSAWTESPSPASAALALSARSSSLLHSHTAGLSLFSPSRSFPTLVGPYPQPPSPCSPRSRPSCAPSHPPPRAAAPQSAAAPGATPPHPRQPWPTHAQS